MEISGYDTIEAEMRGKVLWVTLNRPDYMNALGPQMVLDLTSLLEKIRVAEDVRALVITGRGKAFSAGGDVKNYAKGIEAGEAAARFERGGILAQRLYSLEKPYVAAVNGAAAGAGFGLALASDMAIASVGARFIPAFMKVGLIPDLGLLYMLPRIVGMKRAKEILFTARTVRAEEAKELGLVNEVVKEDQLESEAMKLAETLGTNPPIAFAQAKGMMHTSFDMDYRAFLSMEGKVQALLTGTRDFKEGVRAFMEKREPDFIGR